MGEARTQIRRPAHNHRVAVGPARDALDGDRARDVRRDLLGGVALRARADENDYEVDTVLVLHAVPADLPGCGPSDHYVHGTWEQHADFPKFTSIATSLAYNVSFFLLSWARPHLGWCR
jgi:hypothetical protein